MVSVILYHCILWVALLMDLFVLCVACLTVFVNCLVKQFAMCLGVVVILLLNVMKCLVGVVVLCWIDYVWSYKECASSFHMFCLCMSEVISSFKSWITCVCSPYVIYLCDFVYYMVG